MPCTASRVSTFFNVEVHSNGTISERFSYNSVAKGQRSVAQGIMRGFEQSGCECRITPADEPSKRHPSIAVWSQNRTATKFSMSGTRLGDLLVEALRGKKELIRA
jgi:hypothetical protein